MLSEAPDTAVPCLQATHAYTPLVYGVQRQQTFVARELSMACEVDSQCFSVVPESLGDVEILALYLGDELLCVLRVFDDALFGPGTRWQ